MARLQTSRSILLAERRDMSQLSRIRQNERLALPRKPVVRIKTRLVEVAIQFGNHFRRVAKGTQKSHARWVSPYVPHLLEHLQQREIGRLVSNLVGDIEDNG